MTTIDPYDEMIELEMVDAANERHANESHYDDGEVLHEMGAEEWRVSTCSCGQHFVERSQLRQHIADYANSANGTKTYKGRDLRQMFDDYGKSLDRMRATNDTAAIASSSREMAKLIERLR